MSEVPSNSAIATALSEAQAEMQNAPLNRTNPHFKSKYADLAAIREATLPSLTKHGLSLCQLTHLDERGFFLVTRLTHKSGEVIESEYPVPMSIDRPQVMGSALTYARRYSWAAICGIAAEEDDDANAAQEGVKQNGTKRTREQISQEANRKRQDVRDVETDVAQIDNFAALARYKREVLTPDFMASLGMKQYVVEEAVGRRERELGAEAETTVDKGDAAVRDTLIERIQGMTDEDTLIEWKEGEDYAAKLASLPKPMQIAVRKAGALKMESLRLSAMHPAEAG